MIPRLPFGRTGHESSRVIFGAAAFVRAEAREVEVTAELLARFGVNHIDTAAAYGDSELHVAQLLSGRRDEFFLATKTVERGGAEARASLERSLTRLGVDRVDLIQLHNLVDREGIERAFAADGAVAALARAREEGLVRFLGVTGHGPYVAARHRESLLRFDFDAVLLPYNFTLMSQPDYAADFEALAALCAERGVALQTIKAVARRRWAGGERRGRSWYQPLEEADAIGRAVRFALSRQGTFLCSSSELRVLPAILEAAEGSAEPVESAALRADVARYEMEALFIPGISEDI